MTERSPLELDPRYEWTEIASWDGTFRQWIKNCRHVEVVPVESGGVVVARLCIVCDAQLPGDV